MIHCFKAHDFFYVSIRSENSCFARHAEFRIKLEASLRMNNTRYNLIYNHLSILRKIQFSENLIASLQLNPTKLWMHKYKESSEIKWIKRLKKTPEVISIEICLKWTQSNPKEPPINVSISQIFIEKLSKPKDNMNICWWKKSYTR